jgi:pyruvate,water dikinase
VEHVLWFDRHDPGTDHVLGGKNASLGSMTRAGLPVPPGFAVSASAYREVLARTGVDAQLETLMDALDPTDTAAVSATGAAIRAMIHELDLAATLRDRLHDAYGELCNRTGHDDLPVAVRSSATCEDQPDASFAGEHDTYLWIRGSESVVGYVQRCWASLYSDRAICYRRRMRYAEAGVAMSVGVQQMVLPRTSGVAFTLNPLNGDRSQVAIDASWGLGEAVVSGSVTPDNFLVDKVIGEITRRTISPKAIEHVLGPDDQVMEREVEPERRDAPSLSDDEIRAVAKLARRAEKHYGCPQDVEWALDPNRPEDDNIVLLQSRPETVWSRKARVADEVAQDTYASIVNTLLHPAGSPAGHSG